MRYLMEILCIFIYHTNLHIKYIYKIERQNKVNKIWIKEYIYK